MKFFLTKHKANGIPEWLGGVRVDPNAVTPTVASWLEASLDPPAAAMAFESHAAALAVADMLGGATASILVESWAGDRA